MNPMQIDDATVKASSKAAADNLETPTSKMAKLEVKTRTKRVKLASSKSLTQFVPRSLFFLRRTNDSKEGTDQQQQQSTPPKPSSKKLVTCRSFPTENVNNTSKNNVFLDYSLDEIEESPTDHENVDLGFDMTPEICDRMDALKAWPRLPSSSSASIKSMVFGEVSKSNTGQRSTLAPQNSTGDKKKDQSKDQEAEASENGLPGLGIIFNPIKGRFLFMRGNRSVQPRCRSKQPFTKLTNEPATPSPTKLYSPFGIETPDNSRIQTANSKRKLDLIGRDDNKKQKTPDRTNSKCSDTKCGSRTFQLKVANKELTNFVSPTGKFRETVNYVEQSQREIEAISKAIMTRSALNSNNHLNSGSSGRN